MVLFTQCIFIKLYPVHVIKNLYQIFLSTKPLLKNVRVTNKASGGELPVGLDFLIYSSAFSLFY